MAYYPKLKNAGLSAEALARTGNNLLTLKNQLKTDVPEKDLDEHLLLATWNIRDLGKKGPKHGKRTMEDLFYIAEIISNFDLVAVQEVNDLDDWETIMAILGREWDYIATDISDWSEGGNGERMTFVYDKRKVWFKNIAGEVVLSRTKLITDDVVMEDDAPVPQGRQFARTPFLVSFQAGWFNFDICTVHIYFGEETGAKLKRRIKEIEGIARELSDRAKISLKEKHSMILLGDFNIVHPEHETMQALTKQGFIIPKPLKRPTNINKDKYYDQIAIKTSDDALIPFTESETGGKPNAGVFEIFNMIMQEKDWLQYKDLMSLTTDGKKCQTDKDFKNYFKEWRTYHLSDHQPLWIRVPIDKSEDYIRNTCKI